jgi:hypothetical protein
MMLILLFKAYVVLLCDRGEEFLRVLYQLKGVLFSATCLQQDQGIFYHGAKWWLSSTPPRVWRKQVLNK